MTFRATFITSLFALLGVVGCADKKVYVQPIEPSVRTTNADKPQPPVQSTNGTVGVSDDIAQTCRIQFGNAVNAPKFDFADSELPSSDRAVLAQVATCVTTGPLRGRAVSLVGRADPRGEAEYNMSLGEHRADTVRRYLTTLGVASNKLSETSRGKLDASGTDESSWHQDRRVDLVLR